MKTIAITMDEPTLRELDLLGSSENRNRSEIIREAMQDYVAARRREQEEEKERGIFHRLRHKLKRQGEALVKEQAKL